MHWQHLHKPGKGKSAVVFFHGYGADMHDLAPLQSYLDTQSAFDWYFPNGPHPVPFGGVWEGRAWFPIDMAELEQAMRDGRQRSFAQKKPPELAAILSDLIAELLPMQQRYEHLVLGGFSQGAMVATHLASQLAPSALVVLSGTLLDQAGLLAAQVQKTVPFFQSHGDSDPLLSLAEAKALHQLLESKGWEGIWAPFRGGHEIPPQVVQSLAIFLQRWA